MSQASPPSFVPSFLRSFVPSFLRSFVPSFLRSFLPSFLRSFCLSPRLDWCVGGFWWCDSMDLYVSACAAPRHLLTLSRAPCGVQILYLTFTGLLHVGCGMVGAGYSMRLLQDMREMNAGASDGEIWAKQVRKISLMATSPKAKGCKFPLLPLPYPLPSSASFLFFPPLTPSY